MCGGLELTTQHRTYAAVVQYIASRRVLLALAAEPKPSIADQKYAVEVQSSAGHMAFRSVAGPERTITDHTDAVKAPFSANDTATPGAAGPLSSILYMACVVMVK